MRKVKYGKADLKKNGSVMQFQSQNPFWTQKQRNILGFKDVEFDFTTSTHQL